MIDTIQDFCVRGSILLTKHASHRLEERGITFLQIRQAIANGDVIEDYPTDSPNPSVLILGNADNNPVHVVVGISNDNIQIITAYYPTLAVWESDMKTRKVAKK